MCAVTINTNPAWSNAQRRLTDSTRSLDATFRRLSSGLRINRAADDAAGLAIASGLDVDARIYSQGIRNFNDGVSLLNIAEGALSEASGMLIRIRELSTQSANGTLTNQQRGALDEEANALIEEYNRVMQEVSFNDLSLLDRSISRVVLQGGYGTGGQISIGLGDDLSRRIASGSFSQWDGVAGADFVSIISADLNGDGLVDFAGASAGANELIAYLRQADGTLASAATYSTFGQAASMVSGDFNGDGSVDIVVNGAQRQTILIGNGDGTFLAGSSFGIGSDAGVTDLSVGDFNADGNLDLVLDPNGVGLGNGYVNIIFGNGDGTFGETTTLSSTAFGEEDSIAVVDFDGDGTLDIVQLNDVTSDIYLHFGRGNGTFGAAISSPTLTGQIGLLFEGQAESPLDPNTAHPIFNNLGDVNGDGTLDLVSSNPNTLSTFVAFGQSNGTFSTPQILSINGEGVVPTLGDFNGDGILDLVSSTLSDENMNIRHGNGDGTFAAVSTTVVTSGLSAGGLQDLNGDGVLDLLLMSFSDGTISSLISDSKETTMLARANLHSRAAALREMPVIDESLRRIARELGTIGAVQSRLNVAVNNLSQAVEGMMTSKSRIVDADIAEESASLVRANILQQAGAAVLAQANTLPELALELIR